MKAKPFVKWVGGKSQLLSQLNILLPMDVSSSTNLTYIEPFVGGGAMLFHMLQEYPNIGHAVINDINSDLTGCYKTVRDQPLLLINALRDIEQEYHSLQKEEDRKSFFLNHRDQYNQKNLDALENTVLFLFLNRTFTIKLSFTHILTQNKHRLNDNHQPSALGHTILAYKGVSKVHD